MDIAAFTGAVARFSAEDLRRVARAIASNRASVADDLAWWEATMCIDRTLKATHRTRAAAVAALEAGRAVQAAARAAGVPLPDDDVTRVARAAGEVARGITAGPPAAAAVSLLLTCWTPLFVSA